MLHDILHYAGIFFFGLLVLIAVGATVIPMFSSKQWYVRIFDYPRLQTFGTALIALAWYFLFYYAPGRNANIFIGLFVIVIVVQGYKAWPYTAFAARQVATVGPGHDDASLISIYISNVLQANDQYHLTIQKIRNYMPDVVVTTETNHVWQEKLTVLHEHYPHRIAVPQNNRYGMHLFSKLPLRNEEVRYLIKENIPSVRTELQLRNSSWITLFVVHPRPPAPTEADDSEARDAEIVLVARQACKETGGVIVAGDFNDVAWSGTTRQFRELSGLLDPRRGRGFYNTYHAKYPIFRWPLDHIFHSKHFSLKVIQRGGDVNSDHFPMYVQLGFETGDTAGICPPP